LEWREKWAKLVNAKFQEKGLPDRIDHRSNIERGLDELPTIHEGPAVRAMEKRGIRTNVGEWNRMIKQTNCLIRGLKANIRSLLDWISVLKVEISSYIEEEKMKKADVNILVDTLSAYYERRNAGAYSRKAKASKAKKYMEIINFLTENKITSIPELETVIGNMYGKVIDIQSDMKEIASEQKTISEVLKAVDDYNSYKQVHSTLCSIKKKSKAENFKASHRLELTKFYMARRIISEKYPDHKVPVKQLQLRLEELEANYSSLFSKYKAMKDDASKAYSLRKAIESDYKKILQKHTHEIKRKEPSL
jgi:hypothetical protein